MWNTNYTLDQVQKMAQNPEPHNKIAGITIPRKESKNEDFVTYWHDSEYTIISKTKLGGEILKEIHNKMQNGDIAISGNFSFLFEDYGLSFLIPSKLKEGEINNKKLADNYNHIKYESQKRINEELDALGVNGFGNDTPFKFSNVQTTSLTAEEGNIVPLFYYEIYDLMHRKDEYESIRLFDLPDKLTREEILHVAKLKDDPEFLKASINPEAMKQFIIEEIYNYRNNNLESNKDHIK